MSKKADILIFSGQSNMQGQTEALPDNSPDNKNIFEYLYLSDELIPLTHPVGETFGEEGSELTLLSASLGHGSLVPDFCDAYSAAVGKNVIAVHAARGNTRIAQWQKGEPLYISLVKKAKAAILKAREHYEINKIYFIWLQGESDAINRTDSNTYCHLLTAFKNDLKAELSIDIFGIIKIGYFCFYAKWLDCFGTKDGIWRDEEIMHAQDTLCRYDNEFLMLSDICPKLSIDKSYINPKASGHYNNKAMSLIGQTAGKTLAEYEKNNYKTGDYKTGDGSLS